MNQTQVTDTVSIQVENWGPAFVLASLVSSYPDNALLENTEVLLEDTLFKGNVAKNKLLSFSALIEELKIFNADQTGVGLDNLRSEYIDLFDRGRQINSLYETEYGRARAMVKGNELVDIAGFYRAFGFETGGDGVIAEMIDHVSVELEFYALLCLKSNMLEEAGDQEGVEIVLDARKKFLKSHLGRFVAGICERPGVQTSTFYRIVFDFVRELVQRECKNLSVEVETDFWLSDQAAGNGEITCGGEIGGLK